MNAFAAGINAIFLDPHVARDGVHRAGGNGAGTLVRVILRAPDRVANWGDGRYVTDTVFIDVRVAEVPALEAGDTFEIAGEIFEVRSDPVRDRERLCWAAEARRL